MFWHKTWEQSPGPAADAEAVSGGGNRPTSVIGAAIGIGATDTGCELGPDRLAGFGPVARLQRKGHELSWTETIRAGGRRAEDDVLPRIAAFSDRLAEATHRAVVHNRRACVLGGDHSCAIGTWSGIYQALNGQGPLGLIWIDAHMDSHTPDTSPSGAVHGMPLACLLGYGPEPLVALGGHRVKLLPENVCLIGVRSFEPAEAALLRKLGVRIFFMDEVRRRGLAPVMNDALALVQRHSAGFGLTLDLDAIDPSDAPGVGSLTPGGICGKDLANSLSKIADEPALLGVEIAELNPEKDVNNKTAELVHHLLASIVGLRGTS